MSRERRKYGRTKIPHVRREIDEIERVGGGGKRVGGGHEAGSFLEHDEGVEEMIGEERHRVRASKSKA